MTYDEIIKINIDYEEMIKRQKKRISDNIASLTIESDSKFVEEYEKWLSELETQEPEFHSYFLDVYFYTKQQKEFFLKAKLYGRFVEEISCLDLAFLMMLKIDDRQHTREWTFSLSELIEKGANIHAIKDEALKDLVHIGQLEFVQLLVEKGADINASIDGWRPTAFALSALYNHFDIFNYLLSRNANIQPGLFGAVCMKGHLEIVKILLQHKDKIDIHEDDDDALVKAFQKGHFEIVDLLLEHGADPTNIKLENTKLALLKYINSRDMKNKLLEDLQYKEAVKRSKI